MPARQKSEVQTVDPQPQTPNEAEFIQEDQRFKAMLDAQDKVRVMIAQQSDASSDDPLPDVVVGINGYTYQIKRGEFVDVPESVAEVLQNSMDSYYVDEKGRKHQARRDLSVMIDRR